MVIFYENILLNIIISVKYLPISRYIYNGYPKFKSIFGFWSYRQTLFWVISQEQHYQMMLQPTFNFKGWGLIDRENLHGQTIRTKLSLNYLFYNVNHYKSVHQHLSTLPVGKGNRLLALKTNQEDFTSNKCPNMFSSWSN